MRAITDRVYEATMDQLQHPNDWDQLGLIEDIRNECCDYQALALIDWLLERAKLDS